MHTEPSPRDRRPWADFAVAICFGGLIFLLAMTVLGRFDRAPGFLLTAGLFLLPHLFLAHLAATFALWVVLPDRRAVPAIGAANLLVATGLWASSLATWGTEAPPDRIRMVTWNVQRLWGLEEDLEAAGACVRAGVEAMEPDVITLLEVSSGDVESLSEALGLRCVHSRYHNAGAETQGGLAVCVRGSLVFEGAPQRFNDHEDWNYVFSEVRKGDRTFNVLAVHLWPYRLGGGLSFTRRVAHGQADQGKVLLSRVARFKDPTLVAGDFNSTRDFHLHSALREHLQDTWEVGGLGFGATKFVKDLLPIRIDYIYASKAFLVHHSVVPALDCSDHRPVVTDLSLP